MVKKLNKFSTEVCERAARLVQEHLCGSYGGGKKIPSKINNSKFWVN